MLTSSIVLTSLHILYTDPLLPDNFHSDVVHYNETDAKTELNHNLNHNMKNTTIFGTVL